MLEIEFSAMGSQEEVARLRPLLDKFEAQNHVRVSIVPTPWSTGWTDLVKIALYGYGPDISEVGTTWIGSLATVNALRPFTTDDIKSVGGPEAFLPQNWASGLLIGDPQVWAIPWLSETEVIFYRKDWLEKAGISDGPAAFATHDQMEKTLERLLQIGIVHPLILSTDRTAPAAHEAATWIWGEGGDLISPDGKRILFTQPEAFRGLSKYFGLRRFISPEGTSPVRTSFFMFTQGQAAVTINSTWLGWLYRFQNPAVGENVGCAVVPGTSFVGGTSLVMWKHCRQSALALDLIRFLTTQPLQVPATAHSTMFPARRAVLEMPSMANDPFYQTYIKAHQTGKSFLTTRLWGSVEENFYTSLAKIWNEVLSNPFTNVNEVMAKYLEPVARRLNIVLGN